MRTATRIAVGLLALAGVLSIAGAVLFFWGGPGARNLPGAAETSIARILRHLAIPSYGRRLANPLRETPEILHDARSHFADHCASCHGNDGKGMTELGRNLSPRVPDMTRQETQSLSDGELFFIIKNGVRLTGMPAWGKDTPEDDQASWRLVLFIRHLPKITAAELSEMEVMNPVSPLEMKEREEEARFLEGKAEPRPASRPPAGNESRK